MVYFLGQWYLSVNRVIVQESHQLFIQTKLFFQQYQFMNKSSANIEQHCEQFSSGAQIFKLKPIPNSKDQNKTSFHFQIQMSSFLQKEQQHFQFLSSNNSYHTQQQDKNVGQLFGVSFNKFLIDSQQNKTISGNICQIAQQKQEHAQEGKDQLYAAFPKANKCLICKETFENYFEHVQNFAHKKKEKSFIKCGEKSKVPIEELILKLANSISKAKQKGFSSDEEKQNSKRSRVNQNVDESFAVPNSRKRRNVVTETSGCAPSLESTCLLNSNSLIRKESFFG